MDDEVKRRLARLFPDLEQRWGGCERKLAYATLADALTVKERREARAGISLRVYACEYDAHYHLTSQPLTDAQRDRQEVELRHWWQGLQAEYDACQARHTALARRQDALMRAIQARAKGKIVPHQTGLRLLAARYEASRDDWVRMQDLWEEVRDLEGTRDILVAVAEQVQATGGTWTAAVYEALAVRCAEIRLRVEAQQEADAAWFRDVLAQQEASYAANVVRMRTEIATHYHLPSFGPERTG